MPLSSLPAFWGDGDVAEEYQALSQLMLCVIIALVGIYRVCSLLGRASRHIDDGRGLAQPLSAVGDKASNDGYSSSFSAAMMLASLANLVREQTPPAALLHLTPASYRQGISAAVVAIHPLVTFDPSGGDSDDPFGLDLDACRWIGEVSTLAMWTLSTGVLYSERRREVSPGRLLRFW